MRLIHTRTLFALGLTSFALTCLFASTAAAQFNKSRAVSAAPAYEMKDVEVRGGNGVVRTEQVRRKVARDKFGNASTSRFDLAVDGAFDGQTIAVLQFYTLENFDFSLPKAAVAEKGFSVYRWINTAPSPAELKRGLDKASQLWIISGDSRHLTDAHLAVIKRFFESGRGVYIWGDNEPYYSDANAVAQALFGGSMAGNLPGGSDVGIRRDGKVGLMPNHDITTGLEHVFEGITIATLAENDALQPLIYGSAGNMVTAVYEHHGQRAILDGGFTRLYCNWDTAGTARYVKNAAAWLANHDRFGDEVVAAQYRKAAE